MILGETSKAGEVLSKSPPASSSSSSSPTSVSENGGQKASSFDEASFKSNLQDSQSPSPETQSTYGDEDDESQTPQWSMVSASPDITTMKSPIGYDPNRIPSSIFNKATADWSTASNESLFSIHMGKSGELFRIDDSSCHHFFPYDGKSGELSNSDVLPPLMEVSANEENSAKSSSVSRHESYDNIILPFENGRSKKMGTDSVEAENRRPSRSNSRRLSVESVNSATSFAFPLLVQNGSKTGGRSTRESSRKQEEKADMQEQQIEHKETSKTSIKRWFNWFSCWPRRCW